MVERERQVAGGSTGSDRPRIDASLVHLEARERRPAASCESARKAVCRDEREVRDGDDPAARVPPDRPERAGS